MDVSYNHENPHPSHRSEESFRGRLTQVCFSLLSVAEVLLESVSLAVSPDFSLDVVRLAPEGDR